MSSRQRKVSWLIIGILALSMTLIGGAGFAGAAAAPTVLAGGLNSPRYVWVTDDGTAYVSEAGTGGSEQLAGAPDNPTAGGTRGNSGQVTKIAPNGTKTVIAKGLPSYGGGEAVGPAGIVYAGGFVWLAIGGAAFEAGVKPLDMEDTVVKIDPATGAVTKVADIGAYEIANNPDGYGVNSDLYGMTLGADGNLYVCDAGGNAVYQVNPQTGAFKVVAVIPGVAVTPADFPPGTLPPGQTGNPERGNKPEVDPVPTGIAAGADGSLYVTLLPGALLPNKAKVVNVTLDGKVTDVIPGGLTTLVGAAAGPDGNLYITSLTAGFAENGPPAPGSVMRVLPGGKTEVVASGLPFPNGIDFDPAGNLYVVTGTINAGPEPMGQLVRIDGVGKAGPAPTPAPIPSPPPTGNGGYLPGLPNTGAGGGAGQADLPLAGLILALALGGSLFLLRRRAA
jgi:hypothetical protein